MIPAAFDYVRCRSLDEALDALTRYGEDAKLLAGGHSLVPVLKLRLNAPALLVDLGGIDELIGIEDRGEELFIGAMTTYQQVIDDDMVAAHAPVLAQAAHTIADPQVRHRGTLGGALAHADPAGDLGAVAVALSCDLVVAGPTGRRRVPADEFFVDYFETVLQEDEILAGILIPKSSDLRTGWYEKFNRVSHMWSIVGVCAVLRLADDRIGAVRVALTNMAPTPVRASATEAALTGLRPGDETGIAAAAQLAAEGTAPTSDANAQADYRRHLAKVLTQRAISKALAYQRSGEEWR